MRQVRLGAHFPGVNHTTVWADPRSGSHIDIDSFVQMACTAEAAGFDFFFLAEGLRLREKKGLIHDLDVVGRPDAVTVLAALAAVTDHLGLVGTLNATFNEPVDLARKLASLDHLSGGRAGWNVVTSPDAFTGENFRRGGYLDRGDRYQRVAEFVGLARTLWSSWPGAFEYRSDQFDVAGRFSVPPSPQGDPVILQAGDSAQGRDTGAALADAIFTVGRPLEAAREFYRDVKDRLPALGRHEDELLILPAVTFALGDTTEQAEVNAAEIRAAQVSGATAIQYLERIWQRDLTAYDPDGPLPDIDPDPDAPPLVEGQVRPIGDLVAIGRDWRERARERGWSIRQFVIETSARQTFVGTGAEVADQMIERVQTRAADGFIVVPHLVPGGLDDFAGQVVPHLQERGALRTDYTGTTLRENLGLPPRSPQESS